MVTKVGINGFGRIGRQVMKTINERHSDILQVVAVNDLVDNETSATLLKYDSNYGRWQGEIKPTQDGIEIDGRLVNVFNEREPGNIPWESVGTEIVIESTGFFTDATKAAEHRRDSVKKVIISAPAKNEDVMVVLGVNQDKYEPSKHRILSNASCTTNCIANMVKVLHDNFKVKYGLMNTIHAYTNDQRILDQTHEDLRRARSAAQNIIPTTTGAARAVGAILPELQGKIHGMSLRVPVSTGSITDFVAEIEKTASVDDINEAFKSAAANELHGILEYTEDPIVSSDIVKNPHSCIIDGLSTMVMEGNMVKVLGWYDNEWGYSCRTSDLCAFLADKGL